MSGLHWACKRNNLEVVKILLKNGSDVNLNDVRGLKAIYYAVENKNFDIIVLLLMKDSCPWNSGNMDYKDHLKNNMNILHYINKF